MHAQLLIDSIVRQTTVLIAQLATSGGLRAPLAHVANQVFLDLASELERQGVSRKVSADMFGLALRGYQRRLQRLTESTTDRGRSLWEAVLDYVSAGRVRTRAQVMERFASDDEALVRGVLHDLTESGLVFCSGSGASAAYRAATAEELGQIRDSLGREGLDELIWVLVFREGPLSRSDLGQLARIDPVEIDAALGRLIAAGRLRTTSAADPVYSSGEFHVPLGETVGWAAAVLDHFRASVQTICARLREVSAGKGTDLTGGSTYTFVVWPGHPHEQEVAGELARYRERQTELRARVDAHNQKHGIPPTHLEVVSYAGQCVLERERRDQEPFHATF
jgi:hypothetical protein